MERSRAEFIKLIDVDSLAGGHEETSEVIGIGGLIEVFLQPLEHQLCAGLCRRLLLIGSHRRPTASNNARKKPSPRGPKEISERKFAQRGWSVTGCACFWVDATDDGGGAAHLVMQ